MKSKPPIGRVRRSIPPPRDELPTLTVCAACGGKDRVPVETSREGEGPTTAGAYSIIGCRWCRGQDGKPTGLMTPAQRRTWAKHRTKTPRGER